MRISPVPTRLVSALLAVALLAGVALGFAPSVGEVNALLGRAETNLESVASSVRGRSEPPRGSAGKLLGVRLEQSATDLNKARGLLEQIPAGTEGRDDVAARYTALAAEHERLRVFLAGPDAPAPAEGADEGTPLNYQEKDILSGAEFNLREVEAGAGQLTARVEEMRAVEDQLAINHRDVAAMLGVVENARRKSGFASDALARLPEDGRGVAAVRQRLVNTDAKVTTAADYLSALNAKLRQVIDPARYPQLNEDTRRLRDLATMFADPMIFETDRPRAAETFAQADAARAECVRIAQQYARLVQQGTPEGTTLEAVGNGFLGNHEAFIAEARARAGRLPAEIRADIGEANRLAAEAVAEQKPLWFTGGIPQVMGFAEDRLNLLRAIDPAGATAVQREFDEARAGLRQQEASLRELIIRENALPADVFQGADRDKAIETAISGWKVQQKDAKVLKVRIPAESWARETKWTYSNGTWYFSDRSRLQVRLIVADHEDEKLAIDRPVNVYKDHQKGDAMIGVPLFGFEDELQPSSYLLRSKIK